MLVKLQPSPEEGLNKRWSMSCSQGLLRDSPSWVVLDTGEQLRQGLSLQFHLAKAFLQGLHDFGVCGSLASEPDPNLEGLEEQIPQI